MGEDGVARMPATDMETFDFSKVDAVIEKYNAEKSWLIMILQDTQTAYNWLPQPVLERVAERLALPLSHVYNVATFYASFSLKERGRHLIRVCDGTACHLRRSTWLLDEVRRELGISEGEMTADRMFTLETVACLGACALAPVMTIDAKCFPRMTPEKVKNVLTAPRQGKEVGVKETEPARKEIKADKPKASGARTKLAPKKRRRTGGK